jgi:hypothetical protein
MGSLVESLHCAGQDWEGKAMCVLEMQAWSVTKARPESLASSLATQPGQGPQNNLLSINCTKTNWPHMLVWQILSLTQSLNGVEGQWLHKTTCQDSAVANLATVAVAATS